MTLGITINSAAIIIMTLNIMTVLLCWASIMLTVTKRHFMLNVVMLSIVLLSVAYKLFRHNVVMLSVVMLNVVAPLPSL